MRKSSFCWLGIGLGLVMSLTAAAAELSFSPNGTFKIVQFTDTHLDFPESYPGTDAKTLMEKAAVGVKLGCMMKDINDILDAEKPDLVVFTGDNVLTPPALLKKGWLHLTKPAVDRHIPWIAVMGNHDPENRPPVSAIVKMLSQLPGSLDVQGPPELGGGGNFILPLIWQQHPAAMLYFLDSGRHSDRQLSDGYAWLTFPQIVWFRDQTARITAANHGRPLPALAFFHIPFPEFITAYLEPGKKIGVRGEDGGCPLINSGMFAAMLETRSVMGVFTGHDHDNDYAVSYHGICLAYGRKTGVFCYLHNLTSGARVIELQAGKRTFTSWIRTGDGQVINKFVYPNDFPPPEKKKK